MNILRMSNNLEFNLKWLIWKATVCNRYREKYTNIETATFLNVNSSIVWQDEKQGLNNISLHFVYLLIYLQFI